MEKYQRGFVGYLVIVWGVVVLFGLGGWIANIVKLVGSDFGTVTGMLVARGFGIVVPPLGAVLGFI